LPVHGWTEESGVDFATLAARCARAGARHVLCTDIARDGTLGGFSLDLYRDLLGLAPGFAVQASGGASSLDDIRAVRATGVVGVILGRALLERRFTLAEALTC
jgi:phosphoribosylformimino-5-aminoimidazole carboxamide ribotide isomerase